MELEFVGHCRNARENSFKVDHSESPSKRYEEKLQYTRTLCNKDLKKKVLKIKTCTKITSRSNSRSIKRGTADSDESHVSDFFSSNIPNPKRSPTKKLRPVEKDCSLEEGDGRFSHDECCCDAKG